MCYGPACTELVTMARIAVEQLVEAGANPLYVSSGHTHWPAPGLNSPLLRSIKNKHHLRPIDLLPPPPPPPRRGAPLPPPPGDEDPEVASNEALRSALRRAEAEFGLHGAGGEGMGGDVADGEAAECSETKGGGRPGLMRLWTIRGRHG